MYDTLKSLWTRTANSAVVWSWGFNGLRLASGLLLLPLLAIKLGKPEFGMYHVFLNITALLPFLDFGFSGTIGRFVGYAMAGATELRAQGLPSSSTTGDPNFPLVWNLLRTTRVLYSLVALCAFLIMGIWGTLFIRTKVAETSDPWSTWAAWGITLVAAALEVYSNWWNSFLFYVNRVQQSARIGFLAYFIRLAVACVLLLFGAGLLSVPCASLFGSVFTRFVSRRAVLNFLNAADRTPQRPSQPGFSVRSLLLLLWPNSWRLALQVLSNYFRTSATVLICVAYFGLTLTGQYGLSIQVIGIASGMAAVWTAVKWPRVMQLRSAQKVEELRGLLWPRAWLQVLTFVLLTTCAAAFGPQLLKLIGTDKVLLPTKWLLILAGTGVLELTYVFWGTLLAAENRVPTLWSTVATNIGGLALAVVLIEFTSLGLFSLVIAPLLSGSLFLYWYWPRAGARSLGMTWSRFMFSKPSGAATVTT